MQQWWDQQRHDESAWREHVAQVAARLSSSLITATLLRSVSREANLVTVTNLNPSWTQHCNDDSDPRETFFNYSPREWESHCDSFRTMHCQVAQDTLLRLSVIASARF